MTAELLAPGWLLLLFPAALLWWHGRVADRRHQALRALWLLLTALALAQPRLRLERPGGVLVVLADRSASMPADTAQRQEEIIHLLEAERGPHDRIAVVGFAEKICVEQPPDAGRFSGWNSHYAGSASRLGDALALAHALVPRDRHGRILVLSDGRFTGADPLDSGIDTGIPTPVDYRIMKRPSGSDLAIVNLDLPPTVEPGEAFQFTAELSLPETTELSYRLLRDGRELAAGRIPLAAGRRHLLFQDRLPVAGNARYLLEVSAPASDPCPENNRAAGIVLALGGKPLLHVGPEASRLPELAGAGGLGIVHHPPENVTWTLDGLSRFRGVVLENVPAVKLGYSGQEALARFVADQGGGLMMTGGRQSFGIGGYYRSPLAEILPVSMELRREHRRLIAAVAVVLDRSGSMAMQLPDGRTKMDLADEGTCAVLDLLADQDLFGVFAVDSQAHEVVSLGPAGEDRNSKLKRIRAIESMGGGIFIYEGLSRGAQMLAQATAGSRFLILFADAADSEEPGNYRELLQQMRNAGITVSVIGLGTEQDCDAELLKDIATRGGGNIYFTAQARELPQLFAQEAMTISRAAFIEEPTPWVWGEDLPNVTTPPNTLPPPLGGYNLCYLCPGASLGARTADDLAAPLLAFWQHGAGRVLTFTGEADGKFAGPFGAWPESGPLLLSCLRWTAGRDRDDHPWFTSVQRDGDDLLITLELDPERNGDPFRLRPRLLHLQETPAGIAREELNFIWAGRDRLRCRVPLAPDGVSHCHLLLEQPDGSREVQPVTAQCLPYPLEFRPEPDPDRGTRTLMRLAALTGGSERLSVDGVFHDIPPFRRPLPLWHVLALLALFALMLEVAYRRLGLFARRHRPARAIGAPSPPRFRRKPAPATTEPADSAPAPGTGSVAGALASAKRRARERFSSSDQ